MRAVMFLHNVSKIEATISITMTIKEWKEFRPQLQGKWPSCELQWKIADVIQKAEIHFYSTDKSDKT